MSDILAPFEFIRRIYPPDFLPSEKESAVYRILHAEGHTPDLLLKELDGCLELAFRYNLVDKDLEQRLKGNDKTWTETMNELRVAKLLELENYFGKNCLSWHPKGDEEKIGEFELNYGEANPIFIEVKTTHKREPDGIITFLRNEVYINRSFRNGYEKYQGGAQPFMVILASSPRFDISDFEIIKALIGTYQTNSKDIFPLPQPDGFFNDQNFPDDPNRVSLSAVCIYHRHIWGRFKRIEESLDIYHNPFTHNKIEPSVFVNKAKRQLIRKNDRMEWIN